MTMLAIICIILAIGIVYRFIKDNIYNIARLLVKINFVAGKIGYDEYIMTLRKISKIEYYESNNIEG